MTQHEWTRLHPLGWKCTNCGLTYKTEFKRDKPRIGKFFAYEGEWHTIPETCEAWITYTIMKS